MCMLSGVYVHNGVCVSIAERVGDLLVLCHLCEVIEQKADIDVCRHDNDDITASFFILSHLT